MNNYRHHQFFSSLFDRPFVAPPSYLYIIGNISPLYVSVFYFFPQQFRMSLIKESIPDQSVVPEESFDGVPVMQLFVLYPEWMMEPVNNVDDLIMD